MTISNLEPKRLWKHFEDICTIPRGSGNEKGVIAHVLGFAAEHGLDARTDSVGNVVITKPAAPGVTGPGIVLQAHMDMVCEKNNDTVHDFEKDPIRPIIHGEVVKATGTSLGADNGIGMAAAMALLEEDFANPHLEALFTVDEETGLVGAAALTADLVKGRILLNLDSEEDGLFYIGCAGGQDAVFRLPLDRKSIDGETWQLKVSGLAGGHSGCDINRNRGNALSFAGNMIQSILEPCGIHIVSITGGSKRNAIPREASALIAITPDMVERASEIITSLTEVIRTTLPSEDAGFNVSFSKTDPSITPEFAPMSHHSTRKVLALLGGIPSGVIAMSREMEGLVETSCNMAIASTSGEMLEIVCSGRSSVAGSIKTLALRLVALGHGLGAHVKCGDGYPGWRPDPSSPLIGKASEVFSRLYGQTPEVTAIHAGLECGLIGERVPDMSMISFGPTIRNPHSPDEFVEIASVGRFYTFIRELVITLGREGI
jgi:dipeptidase D